MNLILEFLTEKIDLMYVVFHQDRINHFAFGHVFTAVVDSLASEELLIAKAVGPLVFYDGRMNGRNYIDVIKHELVPYIKKNFDGSEPWCYVCTRQYTIPRIRI